MPPESGKFIRSIRAGPDPLHTGSAHYRNAMKEAKEIFYGLDIQKEYIAVAQYSRLQNAVTLVALQPVSGNRYETLSEELGILRSKFKFIDSRVNCSLPADYAIVKTLPLDAGEKDIEAALAWELEQNIIGSPDEYVFDYQPLESTENGMMYYQVIAYRKERVNELSSLLKAHKLTPRCVDIDMLALVNMFEVSYPELVSRPAVLVHAETADARCILTQNGKLVDYECIRFDPDTDPRSFSEQIASALPRLVSPAGTPVDKNNVPLFAAGMLYTNEAFLEQTKPVLPTTALLHPFRKIECRIGITEDKLASYLPQLTVAVGLAFRGDE